MVGGVLLKTKVSTTHCYTTHTTPAHSNTHVFADAARISCSEQRAWHDSFTGQGTVATSLVALRTCR